MLIVLMLFYMILSTLCSMRTRNYCCCNLIVFTKNKYFTVGIANVNKQSGGNDCGLFAAAYITSIAHGQDPSSIVYNQGLMREHLLTCLETKRMALFPTIRERRVLQSKIVKIEVYCYCRSPKMTKKGNGVMWPNDV